MISYAQNFEDVMLWRALKNVKNGFYVDVGAGRPDLDSVTKHFYEQGWHGINIEPHPEDFPLLAAARPRDLNLKIAIGPQKGAITFYQNKIKGWSTLDRGTATEMLVLGGESLEVQVECLPLQEVLDQYSDGPIHFLKIDVEGYEEEVLKSLDLKKSRPWIVVLEAADIHARLPDPSKSFLQLVKNGYELVYTDALNFFYISQEKSEELKPHFQKPPNIFDGFVHFNSRDQQQHAQYQDLRNLVCEGKASVEALKAENLASEQQRKSQQEAVATSIGGLKEELAQQQKSQKEANLLDQVLLKGFMVELKETREKEVERGQELRQELEAQKVATSKGVKELGDSLVGLKQELEAQKVATSKGVKELGDSLVGLKQELEAQKVATSKGVKDLGDSLAGIKQELIHELRGLVGGLNERQDQLQQRNLAEMDALRSSLEDRLGKNESHLMDLAKYAEQIQDSVVAPSSYLIPAPFSWYSCLYKMLKIKKPVILNKNKTSGEAPKRPGFWRRLEQSIRKRRKSIIGRIGFDREWYLQEYPEVGPSGIDPLDHYLQFGVREGRWKSQGEKLREPIFIPHQLKRGSRNLKRVLRDATLLITLDTEKWAKIKKSINRFTEKLQKSFSQNKKRIKAKNSVAEFVASQIDFSQRIFFYIDHTSRYKGTSGVQRVVRKTAQKFLEKNSSTVFIVWDQTKLKLVVLDAHTARAFINGSVISQPDSIDIKSVSLESYMQALPLTQKRENCWLFVAEIPWMNEKKIDQTQKIFEHAKKLKLRTAFIFYDLIPIFEHAYLDDADEHTKYACNLLQADIIFPISKNSKKELLEFWQSRFGLDLSNKPKIISKHLPGNFNDLNYRPNGTESRSSLQYILCVGSITPHKNQLLLLKAFNELCSENKLPDHVQIKFVGHVHAKIKDEFEALIKFSNRAERICNLEDQELAALYQGCQFSIFPSLREGFGLPILESLFYGRPCICANINPMKEIADAGGCMTINFGEIKEIKNAILELATDNRLLKKLSNEAKAMQFSTWNEYADFVLDEMDKYSKGKSLLGNIYYWVDHTCSYPSNSGIQRVVRCLARALIENGYCLIPVKWDRQNQKFCSPKKAELDHLSLWNGPSTKGWCEWVPLIEAGPNDILLVPELTTYLPENSLLNALEISRSHGLKSAIVFYDAIPWRLRSIYPNAATAAHEQYMQDINKFDKILCISKHSKNELIEYWMQSDQRICFVKNQVEACCLPGEFSESFRNYQQNSLNDKTKLILCVGTVEPRKNHLELLEAFKLLRKNYKDKTELILVGGAPFPDLTSKVEKIIESQAGIKWEKEASDVQLQELYKKCLFTVYPSLEEGFGLPILESLWYGRPCICRNASSMAEIAPGGGIEAVDTTSAEVLANAMYRLLVDEKYYKKIADEAIARPIKTWDDYATEVAYSLSEAVQQNPQRDSNNKSQIKIEQSLLPEEIINQPLLSICITTYNRAEWCKKSLENIVNIWPREDSKVEIIICDNASTDNTREAISPFMASRKDIKYFQNQQNVGMLGNLGKTVSHGNGKFIWLIGDDDLLFPGSIQKILSIIEMNAELSMIYLNYSYTTINQPNLIHDWDHFFENSTPIAQSETDQKGLIKEICAKNENFFTGIYSMVLSRSHAHQAYHQSMDGDPFSELKNCVPSTLYVLSKMMNLLGYWVCKPQIVVNMNVSWIQYAPLWILERIPEVYDLAEANGGNQAEIDKWRIQNLPGINHYLSQAINNKSDYVVSRLNPGILLKRIRHLAPYQTIKKNLIKTIEQLENSKFSKPNLVF